MKTSDLINCDSSLELISPDPGDCSFLRITNADYLTDSSLLFIKDKKYFDKVDLKDKALSTSCAIVSKSLKEKLEKDEVLNDLLSSFKAVLHPPR